MDEDTKVLRADHPHQPLEEYQYRHPRLANGTRPELTEAFIWLTGQTPPHQEG